MKEERKIKNVNKIKIGSLKRPTKFTNLQLDRPGKGQKTQVTKISNKRYHYCSYKNKLQENTINTIYQQIR